MEVRLLTKVGWRSDCHDTDNASDHECKQENQNWWEKGHHTTELSSSAHVTSIVTFA